MVEKMYHLFMGSSEDGRGTPRYIGRTTLESTARNHLERIKANPYAFGHVVWYDEKTEHHVYTGFGSL